MADDLIEDIQLHLKAAREDRAGLEYLQGLGYEGSLAFIAETEATYRRAASRMALTGEEVARITALAHAVARATGVEDASSKEAMSKLVEIGWLMSRWYRGDDILTADDGPTP